MGFKEAVRICLREKYFTFQGRASRSEYWYFYLFFMLVIVVLTALFALIGGFGFFDTGELNGAATVGGVLLAVIVIALYIPLLTAMVRRFHDYNLSGWWILAGIILGMIPYVGILASIAMFVITVLKGTAGDNKYGPDPLDEQNRADVFA